ncbi:MAG: hypothetical protein FD176_194 [Rhodospirillaceae bacterium]|nr:MAG: hypothetical protein FD176_194 [Rhodospirillaceae bacterium]TNC98712.1 MAG: hypothetical protein FD119_183 [Stygiobacter sp.]
MRTDNDFIDQYKDLLKAVDPSAARLSKEDLRSLGMTELCLAAVAEFLPDQDIAAVPSLMLGYPALVPGAANNPDLEKALSSLRHLCGRFGSISAWMDACRAHAQLPETMRCYDIRDRRPVLRAAAPPSILTHLIQGLRQQVPWVRRALKVADPGAARVRVDRGRTLLSYDIPSVPVQDRTVPQHFLTARTAQEPIQVRLADMKAIARQVDEKEAQRDWPSSLPPLHLASRLEKTLKLEGLAPGFFDGETLTLEGANHLVGMLSSGKSTLVMGLIFALAKGGTGKRIAVIVTDTIQGATLAARLRKHDMKATVVSSLYNRERHLNSIHWQQGLSSTGWALSSLGDISQNFSVACPLDGLQHSDPQVIRGRAGDVGFPSFKEKQCHRIYQKVPDDEVDGGDGASSELVDDGRARSCPLWAACPAQDQQRAAVDAQVLIMTPQAFVHMTPDKWTTEHHLTMPELLQYIADLVIIDEADAVQKSLDDAFAPRSQIMGDERDVYAPSISTRSSEKLREKSGLQFSKATNARWQNNFYTFFRLIGDIYAMLQNEQASLSKVYQNAPFTAASLLYELWRKKIDESGAGRADEEVETEFLQLIRVASAISKFSPMSGVAEDEDGGRGEGLEFDDPRFLAAAEALQELARQVLFADYYADILPTVEAMLAERLEPFCLLSEEDIRILSNSGADKATRDVAQVKRRSNALVILLAVVAELALAHYNWLVKAQPAVADDFGIGDAELLTQANSLIRHYRSLLPSNPAGSIFGLLYDEPSKERANLLGGKLTMINHLGVGRYLLTHLHDLLKGEGQVGPNVLMLSGTSWAGGSARRYDPEVRKPIDSASPTFDVQVPVKGVLVQPEAELEAIKKSKFALVNIRNGEGNQVVISGANEKERRQNLAFIAEKFAARQDDTNLFERQWRRLEQAWGADDLADRRRAMLVVNSYADAAGVADALMQALETNGFADWKVFCLVRDQGDDANQTVGTGPRLARPLPRSLVEKFGEEGEKSILVAPMQIVARGHNILNSHGKAAISAIYFLHRPHPRPDDLGPIIGRLNRFALERFDKGLKPLDRPETLGARARRMRYAATNIVRYSLDFRGGYKNLPGEFKAQFAWDMLTPLWQTIGRGIRGGCPVFIGFVDYKFAPLSFDWKDSAPVDNGKTSALVQAIHQLKLAMDPESNPREHRVARLLYEPFYRALCQTEGLKHG